MMFVRLMMIALVGGPWFLLAQSGGERENWLFLGASGRRIGQLSGSTNSALWLLQGEGLESFSLGLSRSRVASASWSAASVSKTLSFGEEFVVSGKAEVGRGSEGQGGKFPIRRYGVDALQSVSKRFTVRGAHEYLRFASVRGHILTVAGVAKTSHRTSIATGFSSSAGGNLGTRWASAEFNLVDRRASLRSGVAIGRTRAEVVGIGLDSSPTKSLQQYFANVTIPTGSYRWTLTIDANRFGPQWQPGAGILLRIPLSKPR